MRVLWITERYPPQRGGVARAAARQVGLLAPAVERLDLLHLSAELEPGWIETSETDGATVYRLGRAASDDESLHLLLQAATSLCAAHRHELLHGFYAQHAGYVAVLASQEMQLPSLVSLRGNDVDRGMFQPSRSFLLHWTLQQATALTSVSRDLLAKVRAFTGRQHELYPIPNSVDSDTFCPGDPGPGQLGPLEGYPRPWIGFAGELRFKKGLPVLLRLAEEMAVREFGSLVLIGGARSDEREQLECWRARQPMAAARLCELPYTRQTETLVSLYRAMDLLVFPSFWDGLPNALLEAMACARPVLASSAGGMGEVIDDGVNGYLLEVQQLDRFPDRVLELCRSPQKLRAIGGAARSWVVAHAQPAAERTALLELYGRLV